MIDKAEIIKEVVKMDDVLSDFAGITPNRRGRLDRCPINDCEGHDGFSWNRKKNVFHCFICDASGDVIGFVMQYLHCDFKAACSKINAKYHLYSEDERGAGLSVQESRAIAERVEARRQKRRAEQVKEENAATVRDELARLDANMVKYAPKTPDDELDPRFVEACQKAAIAEYLSSGGVE